MGLRDHYDEIVRCNRCGFCQVACPIMRATGHEAGVARGRIALLRALIEGRLDWSEEIEEPLFTCLLCGACTTNCFPALPTAEFITEARSEYLDRVGRNPLHRMLFDHLLPFPDRLRAAAHAAAFGKKSGLSKAAKALGLLRFLGRDFPRAEEIVEQFPTSALRERLRAGRALRGGGDAVRVGYFVGCGMDIICPDAAEATIGVLRSFARSVTVLNNVCCGLPAESYGDRRAAQRLAQRNLEILSGSDFDVVITDCSSCAAFLKKYPKILFPPDHPQHGAAAKLASRIRDVVEVVGAALPPGSPQCAPHVVTYHDPCHASRGQGLSKEPREILRSL
ncbi:MAG TPA: (Fe-S)-binding protein, partial [Planctomycetaceae bacterium]|nr:(Fe-S)-binding protein [Planctomycetaceae bacterium]